MWKCVSDKSFGISRFRFSVDPPKFDRLSWSSEWPLLTFRVAFVNVLLLQAVVLIGIDDFLATLQSSGLRKLGSIDLYTRRIVGGCVGRRFQHPQDFDCNFIFL